MPALTLSLSFLLAARRAEWQGLTQLRATADLVRAMCDWVHGLQRERGASNLYLASDGARFADERAHCVAANLALQARVQTQHLGLGTCSADASAAALSGAEADALTEGLQQRFGTMRLLSCMAQLLHALERLPDLRVRVQQRQIDASSASRAYSELIAAMLALVWEAADTALDPGVARALLALHQLMQGKELAGQERAALCAACASASFEASVLQRLDDLVQAQDLCLQTFAELAPAPLQGMWQHLQQSGAAQDVQDWRARLRSEPASCAGAQAAERWFGASSRRIDALRQLEDAATSALVQACETALQNVAAQLGDASRLQPRPPAAPVGTEPVHGGRAGALVCATTVLLQEQARRLQTLSEELASTQAALRARKQVERAKGLLMAQRGLSEEAAYRLLRQSAMQQQCRLADMAERVLQWEALLGAAPRTPANPGTPLA